MKLIRKTNRVSPFLPPFMRGYHHHQQQQQWWQSSSSSSSSLSSSSMTIACTPGKQETQPSFQVAKIILFPGSLQIWGKFFRGKKKAKRPLKMAAKLPFSNGSEAAIFNGSEAAIFNDGCHLMTAVIFFFACTPGKWEPHPDFQFAKIVLFPSPLLRIF